MQRYILFFLLCTNYCFAQNPCSFEITGQLVNQKNAPIGNETVEISYQIFSGRTGIPAKVVTNNNGEFRFCLTGLQKTPSEFTLSIKSQRYIPFSKTIKLNINSKNHNFPPITLYKIELLEGPIPTDVFKAERLINTGENTVSKALHVLSGGFNATVQPISDGSAHYNPVDFRNLGGSRVLFLINGTRKNFSPYVHVNEVPNKGEIGTDLEAIPLFAIEKVKIERQDASTKYGSDAIAGVIDFQLKEYQEKMDARVISGINKTNWDGFYYGFDLNKSFKLGSRGFINFTYSTLNQEESNRANSPGKDTLYPASRSAKWQDWLLKNPDLGMRIGTPNSTRNTIFYNSKIYFSDDSDDHFYSYGGITSRYTKSYANYRAPYWVPDTYRIFSTSDANYNGFLPTFESNILDNYFVFGFKGRLSTESDQLEYNLNYTTSFNDVNFFVEDSFNPSLLQNSPTSFYAGGYKLSMNSAKANLEWTPLDWLTADFGTEFRNEKYLITPGEEKSYTGDGTISYPGTTPQNSLLRSQNNLAFYANGRANIGNFNLDGAARLEKYSNFKGNLALKAGAAYAVLDDSENKLLVRGSWSQGFRTPSLHQRFYGRIFTIPQGPNVVLNRGIFNSESAVFRQLGVPELQSEKSKTFSLGASLNKQINSVTKLSVAADAYLIEITGRIILSSTIDGSGAAASSILRTILKDNNISNLNVFLNSLNTRNAGVDINAELEVLLDAEKKTSLTIGNNSNLNVLNEITELPTTPQILKDAKVNIFGRRDQSKLFFSRPLQKILTYVSYNKEEKWGATLSVNYFGRVSWDHPTDEKKDQLFKGKPVFNLSVNYFIPKTRLNVALDILNASDQYPDELDAQGDFQTNLGGRFKYYREVNQFGYNGLSFGLRLSGQF